MVDVSNVGRSAPSTAIAIQFLLNVPGETLSRSQREAAMKSLVSRLPGKADKPEASEAEYWQPVLCLIAKLMAKPTFYEVWLQVPVST
jgi:nucleolar pre-ribosomal-associated protein 2